MERDVENADFKAADIYSFAITMYEIFAWRECYPKSQFKFPWKIAEFIMNGNRPERISEIISMEEWKNEKYKHQRHGSNSYLPVL